MEKLRRQFIALSTSPKEKASLFDEHIALMWSAAPFAGKLYYSEMMRRLDSESDPPHLQDLALVGCALCVDAGLAYKAGLGEEAFQLAHEASFYDGFIFGLTTNDKPKKLSLTKSERGRLGGLARHAESASMKIEVKMWCENHLFDFKTLGKLAEAVVAAKLNVTPKTSIRRWLTDWAKGWEAQGRWPPAKP